MCEGYQDIRTGKDIEYSDEDKVQYFIEVIERRNRMTKKKKLPVTVAHVGSTAHFPMTGVEVVRGLG